MATVGENRADAGASPEGGAARAAINEGRRLLQAGDADAAVAVVRPFATHEAVPPSELADAAKLMADAGSPSEAIGRYVEAGRGYLRAGDFAQARQNFAAAYEMDGKNMDALFELGRVDVADGKKHDALDKFVEVLRKSNLKHLPALFEAGCLYELDGQHNQAILAFKRVVERDKAHVSAFEHLGNLHQVRNQLPDAVANYVRAAEAAQARFQYADAKRLAQAALGIDTGNAQAQRLLAEAEKSAASPPKAQPPAAALSAQVPTAEQRPATTPTLSDVTPVMPPTAEGPAAPPPPPSTLNIGLPSDVALLEQQSQAMAQLAQVQNAVAQTYRQRMALEEEIKKAQAALEALHRQQQTVEEDLSGKRDELAKVIADREAEEAALASLGDAITKSKSDLEGLRSLSTVIGDVKAKCAAAADLATKTAVDANAVSEQSADIRTKTGAVESGINALRAQLDAAKQAVDAHARELADLANGVATAHGTAAAAAASVDKTKSALTALTSQADAVVAASDELGGVAATVEAKLAQAGAAIKRLEALQAQRKTQFEEIVFKLTPLVGSVAPPHEAAQTAKPAQPPRAAQAPTDSAPSVESLLAAGKFEEAVHRAQAEANGRPKPADYLLDVGSALRSAGKLEDAAKLFASARDRDQSNARARYELGCAYADLGRPEDALPLLQTVEADPAYVVLSQVAIGKCMRRRGDMEAAEERFSKALEIEGRPEADYHQALYELADLHESKGDPESLGLALWSYEELQSGNPNYGDVAQRVAKLKAQLADAGIRPEPAHNGAIKQ